MSSVNCTQSSVVVHELGMELQVVDRREPARSYRSGSSDSPCRAPIRS
jgi:hypothetical protein